MNNIEKTAKEICASSGDIQVSSKIVDIVYSPFENYIQVGLGGEWWNGKIKLGRNELHHKKEKIDEAYKPVTLYIRQVSSGLNFDVMGGTLTKGEMFRLDFTEVY